MVLPTQVPAEVLPYSECDRPVQHIWTNFELPPQVWVTFSDGGSSIYKNTNLITEDQLNRFASFALTAQTTGKKLRVRYPETGLVCPPQGDARSDTKGIWIVEQ